MTKRNIVHCSVADLVAVLRDVNSPQFSAGVFDTPVDMNNYDEFYLEINGVKKRNPNAKANPFQNDGIRCVAKKFKLVTGFDYDDSVENRLINEGKSPNFKKGTVWYDCISKGLAVHKKDNSKYYFRYQYLPNSIIDADYYHQGSPIFRTMFEQYLKDKSSAYANQGLNNPLRIQVVSVDNIIELSLNGTTYIINHPNSPSYRTSYIRSTVGYDVEK